MCIPKMYTRVQQNLSKQRRWYVILLAIVKFHYTKRKKRRTSESFKTQCTAIMHTWWTFSVYEPIKTEVPKFHSMGNYQREFSMSCTNKSAANLPIDRQSYWLILDCIEWTRKEIERDREIEIRIWFSADWCCRSTSFGCQCVTFRLKLFGPRVQWHL